MSYPQEVKELAYTLDPACWVSYSGKPKAFKGLMDSRRIASLERAQAHMDKFQGRRRHQKPPVSLYDYMSLISDIEAAERRAHEIGAHVAGHALNRAKNALGWEAAGDVEKAGEAARRHWSQEEQKDRR